MPLYVQVAERLGWLDLVRTRMSGPPPEPKAGEFPNLSGAHYEWFGVHPTDAVSIPGHPSHGRHCIYGDDTCECEPRDPVRSVVPHYDEHWEAIGPLMYRYGISVAKCATRPIWVAFRNTIPLIESDEMFGMDGYPDDFAYGVTPQVAVCVLLLALSEEMGC